MRLPAVLVFVATVLAFAASIVWSAPARAENDPGIERIVLIRHGEKPADGLGQLTCQGLNRALMLPGYLEKAFPRPDFIFAPDPAYKVVEIHAGGGEYDYVRPLVTLAPTAIRLGMPMHTEIAYNDIGGLADALMEPAYRNATVFVGWEHSTLVLVTKVLLARFGSDQAVPEWSNSDYDTVFELVLNWNEPKSITLTVSSQGFEDIPTACPTAAGGG